MLGGLAALGTAVLLVGIVPLRLSALVLAVTGVGLAAPFVNAPVQVILQTTVPPALQGRIFSLVSSLAGLTAPLGLAVAGFGAEWLGLRYWYVAAGLTCLMMSLLGCGSRPLLRIEEDSTQERTKEIEEARL